MLCWTVAGSKRPSNQLLPLKKIIARKPACRMYLRHFQDGVLHLRFGAYLLSLGVGINVLCYNTMLCWTVAGSKRPSNQLLPLKKIIARNPP